MKLAIIGFMGSGKSTVSKILSEKLALSLVEFDQKILEASQRESIAEIFSSDGEEYFRKLETGLVEETSSLNDVIFSCGGGIVCNQKNIELLKTGNAYIIYLETSFDEVKKRLQGDTTRPLFNDLDRAKELYLERIPLYEKYCDVMVNTVGISPEEVTKKILTVLTK